MANLKKQVKYEKRQIDLTSPAGNAFFLIGTARRWGKEIGMTQSEIDALTDKMKSGDYKNLIKVFDEKFGSICDLVR